VAQLEIAQIHCTIPDPAFYLSGWTPVRGGIAAGAHGWSMYGGTALTTLTTTSIGNYVAQAPASTEYRWWAGYEYSHGQPSDGQYEDVISLAWFDNATFQTAYVSLRRYNVSGQHKFRFWRTDTDAQIGADSAAYAVGAVRRVAVRYRKSTGALDVFINGTSEISTTFTHDVLDDFAQALTCGQASVGTNRYWSAWALYASATDDLNEAHYPEMALFYPNFEGSHDQYADGLGGAAGTADYTRWDDWVTDFLNDGDTTVNEGLNAADQKQTSSLSTITLANTIIGVGEMLLLRASIADKAVVHGALIRTGGGTDSALTYGSQTLPTTYTKREAFWNTPPGGGAWSQAVVDSLQAGHRRDAAATNIFVTAMGLVVVALGATDTSPPAPPPLALRPPVLVTHRQRQPDRFAVG